MDNATTQHTATITLVVPPLPLFVSTFYVPSTCLAKHPPPHSTGNRLLPPSLCASIMSPSMCSVHLLLLVLLAVSLLPLPACPQPTPLPSVPVNLSGLGSNLTVPAPTVAHRSHASDLLIDAAGRTEQLSAATDDHHTELAYGQQRRSPVTRVQRHSHTYTALLTSAARWLTCGCVCVSCW